MINLHRTSVGKAFWHYTLPSIAALMVSGTYQIVDGIFVGHFIGADGLAAISLAWPFVGVLLAFGMMIGMGAGAHTSLKMGAGETSSAINYLIHGLLLLVAVGLPLGIALHFLSPMFLHFQGATDGAYLQGADYLYWMMAGAPIVLGSIALPLLVRNAGAPRLATLAMGIGAISNIALDALFIGYFRFGLQGAAIATLLGELISVAICLNYLLSRRSQLPISKQAFHWQSKAVFDILKTGLSSMLMYLYISFSIVLHNMLLLKHGQAIHVAAYSIAGYLLTFYYLMAEGTAGGMQPLTSFYYGANLKQRVKVTFKIASAFTLGSGIFLVLAIQWSPSFFAQFFIAQGDEALLSTTTWAMRLFLCAMFLDGFLILTATWFQSLGLGNKATFITMSNMMIQIPFLLVLPHFFGLNGVWLAVPLSNICLSLLVGFMLYRQWKKLGHQPDSLVIP
ncbi:MATE family efflux transporter [Vibrio metschnikovii]|uniref:MATE family efflux transporter n=1 Tax=Vibrio metschnikovii TaxID=28172 RepID=UPI001C30E525|nr:MATE family efflux transporter [Vibrio metschnikovii]